VDARIPATYCDLGCHNEAVSFPGVGRALLTKDALELCYDIKRGRHDLGFNPKSVKGDTWFQTVDSPNACVGDIGTQLPGSAHLRPPTCGAARRIAVSAQGNWQH
jgi:hypothetical protein